MRRLIIAAGLLAVVVALVRRWVPVRRFEIAETSMAPELMPGDYVTSVRVRSIRRGMLAVYEHPQRRGFFLTKRVVGLPGETLAVSGGEVTINGARLDEPWARGPTAPAGSWTIEADHVFVLGDDRERSHDDSRRLGPISLAGAGRVSFRYWPPHRIGAPGRPVLVTLRGLQHPFPSQDGFTGPDRDA